MLIYLLLGYLAWCTILYFYQDRLLFPADMAGEPAAPPPSAEVIIQTTADGRKVEAWFLPGGAPPRGTVIYFHGNAELIDQQARIVEAYHRLGWSVLLPEYSGYGRSQGKPSQKRIRTDMAGFYDMLRARADVDPSRIVFHGRSLGGGVAADLALRRKPAALILESTFSSVVRMALKYGAPPFLVSNPYRTDRALPQLDVPLLLFHGTQDTLVPVSHGWRLRDRARAATYIEYPAGHNDFPGAANEAAFWTAVQRFLPSRADSIPPLPSPSLSSFPNGA